MIALLIAATAVGASAARPSWAPYLMAAAGAVAGATTPVRPVLGLRDQCFMQDTDDPSQRAKCRNQRIVDGAIGAALFGAAGYVHARRGRPLKLW